MSWYSVKMRAAKGDAHVSGAERLVKAESPEQLSALAAELTTRAAAHPKGPASSITITLTQISQPPLRLPLLPCVQCPAGTNLVELLTSNNIPQDTAAHAERLLRSLSNMRGAALVESGTHRRLDPDTRRGVRASTFDGQTRSNVTDKNHHQEARTLASKVHSAPGVLAELCISDDPHYSTGYVVVSGTYFRIPEMKGSSYGGRVIIIQPNQTPAQIRATIDYLENTPVIITPETETTGKHDSQ